tara:strand:- start:2129 stop:2899 length:771 start_codon:yes stop_codon:yes gene_type:complete
MGGPAINDLVNQAFGKSSSDSSSVVHETTATGKPGKAPGQSGGKDKPKPKPAIPDSTRKKKDIKYLSKKHDVAKKEKIAKDLAEKAAKEADAKKKAEQEAAAKKAAEEAAAAKAAEEAAKKKAEQEAAEKAAKEKEAAEKKKKEESGGGGGSKGAPTFDDWVQDKKGEFKGPHDALEAYQKEFGKDIPGAGMGAGGKEGKAGSGSGEGGKEGKSGSGTGKNAGATEHFKQQEAKAAEAAKKAAQAAAAEAAKKKNP